MKKADLSLNTVVMAILALVVLIVLILVFREQIGSAAQRYFNIGDDAEKTALGKKCQSFLSRSTRQCGDANAPPTQDYEVRSLGSMEDCQSGQVCWERGRRIETSTPS